MKTIYIVKLLFFAICITLFLPLLLSAQEAKEDPTFFTGISPILLERNASEVTLMNSMSSFWLAIHKYDPTLQIAQIQDRQRFTRTEHLLRLTYGFSKNKNWDLGAELKFANARLDDAARSSPFLVFNKQAEKSTENFVNNNSYHGLSSIGLRLRFMPINSIPELTLQATYQRPVARTAAERYAFGSQRTQAGLTATYFIQSGENIYYFFQADWATLLKSDDNHFNGHIPSISTFVVVRTWENQWFIYPGLTYSMSLSGSFYRLQQQLFGSLGVFYQPSPKFSLLLNWQTPFVLQSGSRSVDFVKESYTGFTIGIRTLLSPR